MYPVPEVGQSLEVEEGVYPVPEVGQSLEVEEGVYPVPEVGHVCHHSGLVALSAPDAPGDNTSQLPPPVRIPHRHWSARIALHTGEPVLLSSHWTKSNY